MALDLSQNVLTKTEGLVHSAAEDTGEDLYFTEQEAEALIERYGIALPPTPLLFREEEQDLFQQLEENPDGDSAREKIIESNLRLVLHIAWRKKKKLPTGILGADDLFGYGYFGLLRAIEHFDWRRNTKFSTCAFWWINQSISRAIEDYANVIRIPVHVHNIMRHYRKTENVLSQELGRSPSSEDIAERMELPVARVEYIKQLLSLRIRISLDEPLNENDDPESNASLKLASMKAGREDDINPGFRAFMREAVLNAVNRCVSLSLKEKEVILLRYGLDEIGRPHTLEEIGKKFNVTRERIRQIQGRVISKLRADPNFEKSVKDFVF